MFPSFPYRNIVSSVSFCFQDANYAYATRQGILTKIWACEQLQKFGAHKQASTYLIFAGNSSKGQILWAVSNYIQWDHSIPLQMFACDVRWFTNRRIHFFSVNFHYKLKYFAVESFLVSIPQIVATQIVKLMIFHFLGFRPWLKTVSSTFSSTATVYHLMLQSWYQKTA